MRAKWRLRALLIAVGAGILLLAAPATALAETNWSSEAGGDSVEVLGINHKGTTPEGQVGFSASRPGSVRGSVPKSASCDAVDYTKIGENRYYVDFNGCFRPDAPMIGPELMVTTPVEPGEEAAEPQQIPVIVTAEDLARLPIAPGGLNVQPDRGWVLVNIDTIVWTDATPQVFDAVVLDTPVSVRVEPISYSWDFGDGSAPLTTTDPGAPYPDHSVSHVYTRASEGNAVTVTTQWTGEFEVNGSGVWLPVAGTAVTSQASTPFAVRTAETSLTNS